MLRTCNVLHKAKGKHRQLQQSEENFAGQPNCLQINEGSVAHHKFKSNFRNEH